MRTLWVIKFTPNNLAKTSHTTHPSPYLFRKKDGLHCVWKFVSKANARKVMESEQRYVPHYDYTVVPVPEKTIHDIEQRLNDHIDREWLRAVLQNEKDMAEAAARKLDKLSSSRKP